MKERSAIVLCGGESRRMGQPKAWLDFDGEPLLVRVVRSLEGAADRIVVVRAPGQELPDLPDTCIVVEDREPGSGPLGGLATGAAEVGDSEAYVFVCGCDYPFLTKELLLELLDSGKGEDVLTIEGDRPQPLCAWYRADALGRASQLFDRGERRLTRFLESLNVHAIPGASLSAYVPDVSMMNVNSPEAYEIARKLAASR